MRMFPRTGARGRRWGFARRRFAWLALWFQERRRRRIEAGRPAVPPAPVVTMFDVVNNNDWVDMSVEWTWDGQGWPDDGEFLVLLATEVDSETVVAIVNGPGRTCSLSSVLPAVDMDYSCRVQYRKGATYGEFSNVAVDNPI